MTLKQWEYSTIRLADAVPTMDPFAGLLIGLRVSVYAPRGPRYGKITAHECYDTDHALCVQKVTVRWDDGETERKSLRSWMGQACGAVGGPSHGTARPAYLRAVV